MKVTLIFDKDEVNKKGEKLKDHLRAFKTAGAPNFKNMKAKTLVADIAIKEAIDLFKKGNGHSLLTMQALKLKEKKVE